MFALVQLLTVLNVLGTGLGILENPRNRVWTIFDFLIFAVYIILSFFTPFAIFSAIAFSPPVGDSGRERLVDLRGNVVRWILAAAAAAGAFVSARSTTDWIAASVLLVAEIFSTISDVSFHRPRRNANG